VSKWALTNWPFSTCVANNATCLHWISKGLRINPHNFLTPMASFRSPISFLLVRDDFSKSQKACVTWLLDIFQHRLQALTNCLETEKPSIRTALLQYLEYVGVFLHMGQGFPHQLPVLENVILHPHVRWVARDDVTISRALLLYKIAFILLGSGHKQ